MTVKELPSRDIYLLWLGFMISPLEENESAEVHAGELGVIH